MAQSRVPYQIWNETHKKIKELAEITEQTMSQALDNAVTEALNKAKASQKPKKGS